MASTMITPAEYSIKFAPEPEIEKESVNVKRV